MSYYIIFSGVLNNLEDTGFRNFKQKCVQHKQYFRSAKENPLEKSLFDVVFSSPVIENVNSEQLQGIFEAVFPMRVRYIAWFDTYCEILCRAFDNLYENIKNDNRAVQYFRHLFRILIPEFREAIKKEDGNSGFLNRLVDINKTLASLVLFAYGEKSSFTLDIDRNALEDMESRIIKYNNKHTDEYEYRERVYMNIICWIVEELICEQDGLMMEEGASE